MPRPVREILRFPMVRGKVYSTDAHDGMHCTAPPLKPFLIFPTLNGGECVASEGNRDREGGFS